jgi:hypothetical protein
MESLSGRRARDHLSHGQVERFQLRLGLLLLDEPELHLNSELLRTWLSYLRNSVEDGQVWIGTHALEAVEAAGLGSSFFYSDQETVSFVRRPRYGIRLRSALSPAPSLACSRFVLVEDERLARERERFVDPRTTAWARMR